MGGSLHHLGVTVFSTCPQSSDSPAEVYASRVIEAAQWSENAGCTGMLVYADNSLADPWLVSQLIVQHTQQLSPLVAVQPIYMHPYAAAKIVATFGHLYRRRIYLNMIAGGFKNDLTALNDQTEHDRRYERLAEYTKVIKLLLGSEHTVTYQGEFYQIRQLKMTPTIPQVLFPGFLISGSSVAGREAAQATGAISVEYPLSSSHYRSPTSKRDGAWGIRVGIIARASADEAWGVAHQRFPVDRRGQLTHQLAMKVSDSEWHRLLSGAERETPESGSAYWLEPFRNYKTFCPYLVGTYEEVAGELTQYVNAGCRAIILDIPPSKEELDHIGVVFRQVANAAALGNKLN